jgi:hypothetical protein
MELGIITGQKIAKNRDGDKNRLILQVEITSADDVREVELISQAGEDINPAKGCRTLVVDAAEGYKAGIAITDDLEPETDPGEKEIYSTDSPATEKKAKIKLATNGDIEIDAYGGATLNIKADGTIEINGNTDFAVTWTDLDIALQTFVTNLNTFLATKKDEAGAAGTLSLDLSSAKAKDVKLP